MPWSFFTDKGVQDLPDFNVSEVEVGTVMLYLGSTAPSGWLLCNGASHPIASHPDLDAYFTANGLAFSPAPPVGEFRLPDMRNRFAFGLNLSDVDFNTIGKTGGSDVHSHTSAAGPNTHTHVTSNHVHTVADHSHTIGHTHTGPNHRHGAGGLVVPENGLFNLMANGAARSASTRAHAHNISGFSGYSAYTSSGPKNSDGSASVTGSGLNSASVRGGTTGTTDTSTSGPSAAPTLGSNGSDSVPPYYSLNYIVRT